MLYSTGIDIVEIERIKTAIDRFGLRFINRIFTAGEIEYCMSKRNSAQHFAARFAAKEAVYKSLRLGNLAPMRWKDIETFNDNQNLPSIKLHGKLLREQKRLGISQISLSLTHSDAFAAAVSVAAAE